MKNPWKKISSKIGYKDQWLTLRVDQVHKPGGRKGNYAYVHTNGPAVMVLAVDDHKNVYLVHQFRYPTQMCSWELPAGSSDYQIPLKAAKRELWEETGLKAKSWKLIGKYQSFTGVSDEILYLYLAKDLTQTGKDRKAEDGIMEIKKVSLKLALKMIKKNQITDIQTVAALLLLKKIRIKK